MDQIKNVFDQIKNHSDLPTYISVHPDEKSKSKKVEIITQLFDNFEMKMEFSYKYCDFVIYQETNSHHFFYFKMLVPPKFFLHQIEENNYESSEVRDQWVRVDNFPLTMQPNFIDELMRVHLMNNSVIKVRFRKHGNNQRIINMFKNKLDYLKLLSRKNIQISEESPLSEYPLLSYSSFKNNGLGF